MTRRISCYVVFVTLIWSVHTQNIEKVPDNMFKSNMTRNDFSNLLQSLVKLNEQRVSVLQRLYKLEDYGVLSEVLRSGDNQPAEKGNPNNLFLIVMSKNESDPTRRNFGYEVVDTVKSLDVGNNKVYPKLNYVLDPAGYISQKMYRKENSIESLFKFIPMDHEPKKTHLIEDGTKEITNTKKSNSGLIIELNITSKEKKYSKFDTVHNKGSPSEELWNSDNKRNNYPPFGYHASPRHEIFVTKMDMIEDTKSYNIPNYTVDGDGSLADKENDYGSPFSKEYANKVPNRQYDKTDSDITIKKVNKPKINVYSSKINLQANRLPTLYSNKYILSNQGKKYNIVKTDIESTTNKKILKIINPVNSHKTDFSNNNQNDKFPLDVKDEDENEYGSAIGNVPNRQYTKMDSDVSIEKVHDTNSLKPKKNTQSPKTNVHINQHHPSKTNKKKSVLNNHHGNKYHIIKADIKTTTYKNRIPVIRPHLKSYKADTLSNNNQNYKFPLVEKVEDENEYGSPIGKYVGNGSNRQYTNHDTSNTKPKINTDSPKIVHSNQHPPSKLNKNKSILNNEGNKYSVIKAVIKSSTIENFIRIISPVTSKTETLSNNKQSGKFPFEDIDDEDENIYGSPFSKEYDDNDPNRQTNKKDSDRPKVNIKVNQNLVSMYSTIKTVIRDTTAKNDEVNNNKARENIHGIENPLHSFNNIVHTNTFSLLTTAKASDSEIPKTTKGLPYKNDDNYDYPKDIGNYNKFSSLTTAKISDSEIPKTTKGLPYKNDDNYGYPKDIRNYNKFSSLTTAKASGREIPTTTKDSPYKNDSNYDYPKDIGNYANNDNQGITRDSGYGVLPRGNENKAKNIHHGNNDPSPPAMESFNVETIAEDSPSQLKYVAHNSKKFKAKPPKDLDHGSNVKSKNDNEYDGEENVNNDEEFVIGQNNDREFSVIVTHVGKDKQEEIKPPKSLRINPKEFDQSENKHIARNGLEKCLNKKARKLCCKSCISAYKNVCTRMKCTSRAKKALKKECKKSCKKTFAKSSSKYSDESTSDESGSDDSDSDFS